jgi:hypothetical protein
MARSDSWTTNGINITYDADTESFSLSGTNTKTDSAWILLNSSSYSLTPLLSGITYYFAHNLPSGTYGQITYNKTGGGVDILAYINGDGSFHKVSFTLPANFDSVARVQIGISASLTTINASGIQCGVYAENPTSWTPYSNICPISGWDGLEGRRTGKNLIDDRKRYSVGDSTVYVGAESNAYTIALLAGTYTISVDFSGELYGMYFREQNDTANRTIWNSGTYVTERSFTVEKDGVYRFWVYRNAAEGGVDSTKIVHVQIELGSTATPYEPYTGDQISVTFPDEAGTVYGGTLDLVSGRLTVDRAMLDLGR